VSIPDRYRCPAGARQHSPRAAVPERRGYRRPAAFWRRMRPRFRTFRFTFARFFSFRLLRFPIFLAIVRSLIAFPGASTVFAVRLRASRSV
jgi:hypothetical protein